MNPVYNPNIVNMLDSTQVLADINTAKKHKVDLIIAILHWGTEYELAANQQQKDFANFLKENGVNMIIGSHPHVVQNAEYLDSRVPVVYSLGNFISNQRKINTNGGILLKVEISKISKQISSISYLPVYVHRGNLNALYQYHLIPTIDFIKSPSKFKIPTTDSTSLVVLDNETRKRLYNLSLWDNVFSK
jgi:poly-gamma-glutamate synthesis protein (capsule biosynthesis protein)